MKHPNEWTSPLQGYHEARSPHVLPHHLIGQYATPHAHGGLSPHLSASQIHLIYDEVTMTCINQISGGNAEYVISLIESCPPEIKLTTAIALGIKADLSEYPIIASPMIRFQTAFMTDENAAAIAMALQCEEHAIAVSNIYNNCPPEQALLAITIAIQKKSAGEA